MKNLLRIKSTSHHHEESKNSHQLKALKVEWKLWIWNEMFVMTLQLKNAYDVQ